MGRRQLRARGGGRPAGRREAGRPSRPTPDVRGRTDRLRPGIGRLCAVAGHGCTDCRPHRAGTGCCGDVHDHAVPDQHPVLGSPPGPGLRHLGGRRRQRLRPGTDPGRPAHPDPGLAVDLLRQRPRHRDRPDHDPPLHPLHRTTGAGHLTAPGRSRPGAVRDRYEWFRLRPDRGTRPRVGIGRDSGATGSSTGRIRRLPASATAPPAPAAEPVPVPPARVHRCDAHDRGRRGHRLRNHAVHLSVAAVRAAPLPARRRSGRAAARGGCRIGSSAGRTPEIQALPVCPPSGSPSPVSGSAPRASWDPSRAGPSWWRAWP